MPTKKATLVRRGNSCYFWPYLQSLSSSASRAGLRPLPRPMASPSVEEPAYDRFAELKAFDETKAGVKGLLDAGLTSVPRIFISPPEERAAIRGHPLPAATPPQVPIIDLLAAADGEPRREAVEQIRRACETWGFFQVVGHGVPRHVLEETLAGARRFHEGDDAEKAAFYTRDPHRKVAFSSSFNLYKARAADWRDTLLVYTAPDPARPDEIPEACREIIPEYSQHVTRVGETLLELLSEALGLRTSHLKEMECDKGHFLLCHYYPACPEPDLTLGGSRHTDAGFISVLLQDDVGGLQLLHRGKWVDVPPVAGALVINLGDLMQLITNDRFKSVEDRVLANRDAPRVSVGCFFTTHFHPSTRLYGPIKELLSDGDNPPKYRETLLSDYTKIYLAKNLTDEPPLSPFKL